MMILSERKKKKYNNNNNNNNNNNKINKDVDGMGDGGGEESNVIDFPAPIYIYIIFKSRNIILNVVIFLLSHIIGYFTIYLG